MISFYFKVIGSPLKYQRETRIMLISCLHVSTFCIDWGIVNGDCFLYELFTCIFAVLPGGSGHHQSLQVAARRQDEEARRAGDSDVHDVHPGKHPTLKTGRQHGCIMMITPFSSSSSLYLPQKKRRFAYYQAFDTFYFPLKKKKKKIE